MHRAQVFTTFVVDIVVDADAWQQQSPAEPSFVQSAAKVGMEPNLLKSEAVSPARIDPLRQAAAGCYPAKKSVPSLSRNRPCFARVVCGQASPPSDFRARQVHRWP